MAWKDKPQHSKVIAIVAISLIAINILLAIILPISLKYLDNQSFVVSTLVIQNTVLLPLTSFFFIVGAIDMWIEFFKKKK